MHYVMSDVHGDLNKFLRMLRLIRFHRWDRLYLLGDVIDRGPDGIALLKFIMEHKNIILLKGNHERDMCKAILQENAELSDQVLDMFELWFDNGGEVTYKTLLEESEQDAFKIVSFVNGLKSYMQVTVRGRDYLLVHAGVFWNPDLSFEKNISLNIQTDFMYEIRFGFLNRTLDLPFTVVSGHTPSEFLPEYIFYLTQKELQRCENHKMFIRKDKILIDCGCGNGHNLGCLRLNDMKEFYVN